MTQNNESYHFTLGSIAALNAGGTAVITNMNTAGKISYFMPILEEIEIYFTDIWGDLITGAIDFQIVLTFDFALPDPFSEPQTIKRARARQKIIRVPVIDYVKHDFIKRT